MNVLLISLLPTTENFGVKYLHSYLREKGYRSTILFLPRHTPTVEKPLVEFVGSLRPSLIGCGFMSCEAPFAAHLGRFLKETYPAIPLVAGGIHPTIDPEGCLGYADAACVGESEETVAELAEKIKNNQSVQGIANLAFKNGNTVQRNPVRPLIEDLDTLPFPGHLPSHSYVYHKDTILPLTLPLFKRYTRYDGKAYNIISSRGCPFSCSYCCNSFISKLYGTNRIRKRSPGNVIEELRSVIAQFPDLILINIHDDCFLAQSREWHQEFARDYKRWIARPFIVRSTPLHLTEEKVAILKAAGLAWVTMGLQSGSERINKGIYQRNVSNEQFLKATSLAKQFGVSGYYDVILDNPFEEEDDVIHTLRVLEKIPKPFQLQLFTLTFYKGTDLYLMMRDRKGESADLEIQNYFHYRPTFLNRLVRISPLIPAHMVEYLITHRETRRARILLTLLHAGIIFLLEPLSYFYLMLKGFNYRLGRTLAIALPTFKTKMRERGVTS